VPAVMPRSNHFEYTRGNPRCCGVPFACLRNLQAGPQRQPEMPPSRRCLAAGQGAGLELPAGRLAFGFGRQPAGPGGADRRPALAPHMPPKCLAPGSRLAPAPGRSRGG